VGRTIIRLEAASQHFPSWHSIDHQRIPFNLRDEAKGLLGLWFGER